MNWTLVVEAAKSLAWPLVTLVALYTLRRPLIELIGQVARRARKVSVFDVSIELAKLPELTPTWSVGNEDPRRLSSSQLFDSASHTLFQELAAPAYTDYAMVDLRAGQSWLTSRLFIFSLILGEVTGIRAFVFLESTNTRRKFVGVASPAKVRRALGRRYPWLEEAFAYALASAYTGVSVPEFAGVSTFSNLASPLLPAQSYRTSDLVRNFIEKLQRHTVPPDNERNTYLEMGTSPEIWERCRWIDGEVLERDLSGVLEYDWVEDSPDIARSRLSESILRRKGEFVALVESDRRFVGLIDRYALLEQVAASRSSERGDDQVGL